MTNGFRKLSAVLLVPVLANLLSFAQVLPARAASTFLPLTAISAQLSEPGFSSSGGDVLTNISYQWQQSAAYTIVSQHPCINNISGCVLLKIILSKDDQTGFDEVWSASITPQDMTYSGPANSYIANVSVSNYNAQFNKMLTVAIGCTAACTFTTSTVQTLDIVNYPIYTPLRDVPTAGQYESFVQMFEITTQTYIDYPVSQTPQGSETVNVYGPALNVTASIDANLSFQFAGRSGGQFYTDESDIVDSADGGCYFGTLTPNEAKVCLFDMHTSTNAPNGYSVYVVQDQNMTFNGNTIKQFNNGSRRDEVDASVWSSPSTNAQAHLGYSSDDQTHHGGDLFVPISGSAVWAGIPNKADAGTAASSPLGLVADEDAPGDYSHVFALKVEANVGLPQAVSALGQEYSNNLYFIVVGNF